MPRSLLVLALLLPASMATSGLSLLAPAADSVGLTTVAAGLANVGTARADNIRRRKLKKIPMTYRPPFYRSSSVTQDDGDGESTDSVATAVTYMDADGNSITESNTATEAAVEKVFFDWTPPADFAGGTLSLGCTDCGDDPFSDAILTLDFDNGWSGDTEDVGDTGVDIRAWKRGNGSYRFRLKGKPADIASLGFTADGFTPAASLTLDGDSTDYQFTREVWRTDFAEGIAAELPEQAFRVATTTYDESGAVLDSVVGTLADSDVVRDGVVIEQIRLTETNRGDLKLRADVFSNDITDTPTLNFDATDDNGEALLSLEEQAPGHSEYQFATELTLVEPDNFVDMTYIVNVSLLDNDGAEVDNFDITHTVSEVANGDNPYAAESLVGAEGEWEYALLLSHEDSEDFGYVRVTVAGPQLQSVASATLTFESDDGGTDVDPDVVEAPFVGAWHVWTERGDAGSGGLGDGNTVDYSATVASAGDFDAPIGETDLNGGSTDGEGPAYRTEGFGSGTKKQTRSTRSRAELQ